MASVEVPYLLREADCTVDLFCFKGAGLLKNRHWDNWIEAPRNIGEYVGRLARLLEQNTYDWVIVSDDSSLRALNNNLTDPTLASKILPLSNLHNRAMLGSKAGLAAACAECGVLAPHSRVYNPSLDISLNTIGVQFPLLLKEDESSSGHGVHLCADAEAMKKTLAGMAAAQKSRLVIQEYVPGDTISVEALYRSGRLLAYTYSKVLATVSNEFSVSLQRLYMQEPSIEKPLTKAGSALGIHGFATMTFMHSKKDAQYYLVEADLRAQTWFALGRLCGVNFSLAIKHFLAGTDVCISPTTAPYIAIHFARDLRRCFLEGDTRGIYAWILNKGGRWRFIPWYDRTILYYALMIPMVLLLKRGFWFLRPPYLWVKTRYTGTKIRHEIIQPQ